MSQGSALKLAALAAIAGGLLRALSVFLSGAHLPNSELQQFYFAIDFLLLLGVFGVYAENTAKLGWVGLGGFAVFVFGILLVRSPHVSFLGAGGYQAAAGTALIGINVLGAMMLARGIGLLAPLLWAAALAAGLWVATGFLAGLAIALSGLLFGAGFVAAGTRLLRAR